MNLSSQHTQLNNYYFSYFR